MKDQNILTDIIIYTFFFVKGGGQFAWRYCSQVQFFIRSKHCITSLFRSWSSQGDYYFSCQVQLKNGFIHILYLLYVIH